MPSSNTTQIAVVMDTYDTTTIAVTRGADAHGWVFIEPKLKRALQLAGLQLIMQQNVFSYVGLLSNFAVFNPVYGRTVQQEQSKIQSRGCT